MDPLAALGLAVEPAQPRDAESPSASDSDAAESGKAPFSAEFQNAAPAKKEATSRNWPRPSRATDADQALLLRAKIEDVASPPVVADAEGEPNVEDSLSGIEPDVRLPEGVDPVAASELNGAETGALLVNPLQPSPKEPEPPNSAPDEAGVLTKALEAEISKGAPIESEGPAAANEPRIIMSAGQSKAPAVPAAKALDVAPELTIGAALPAERATMGGQTPAPSLAPALAAAATVDPAHQIVAAVRANPDVDSIDVRLEPPDLGRVKIHFSFERADAVVATLSSERGDTLDLMRRHASDLVRELERFGFGKVQLEFQFGQDKEFAAPRAAGSNFSESTADEAREEFRPHFIVKRYDRLLDRLV